METSDLTRNTKCSLTGMQIRVLIHLSMCLTQSFSSSFVIPCLKRELYIRVLHTSFSITFLLFLACTILSSVSFSLSDTFSCSPSLVHSFFSLLLFHSVLLSLFSYDLFYLFHHHLSTLFRSLSLSLLLLTAPVSEQAELSLSFTRSFSLSLSKQWWAVRGPAPQTHPRDNTMLATVNFGRGLQIPLVLSNLPIDPDLLQFRIKNRIKKRMLAQSTKNEQSWIRVKWNLTRTFSVHPLFFYIDIPMSIAPVN